MLLLQLEGLSNECARVCNQRRSRLDTNARRDLDSSLASLAPIFSCQVGLTSQLQSFHGGARDCIVRACLLEKESSPLSIQGEGTKSLVWGLQGVAGSSNAEVASGKDQ